MFSKFWGKIKRGWSKKEVSDRAAIAEDVLFGKASAKDSDAVLSVAQLTTALCNNNCEAAVDAGVFLFFKVKNKDGEFQIFYKRLTVPERAIVNDKPSLLTTPYKILETFDKSRAVTHERANELRQAVNAPLLPGPASRDKEPK